MAKKVMPMKTFLVLIPLIMLVVSGSPAATASDRFVDPDLNPVFHELPENVEVMTLDNGLEVILQRNPSQPMVGIFTQVRVGSAREDGRTSGMSHMLEHLLFNGSEKYTQEEQYAMADRAGAYNNANTTDFYTNYMMVLPASELEMGMLLQSEMLFHSILPPDKFEKEKGIVLGELVQAKDWPGHEANEVMRQALYKGTSLALPTLGTRSTIENMKRGDVYAFYKNWYVPNNMILTLSGNFDRQHALELLEKFYGSAEPGSLNAPALEPAPYIERTTSVIRRVGGERQLALAFDAPAYDSPDFMPYMVMAQMLDLEGAGIITRALETMDEDIRPGFDWEWQKAPGFGRLTMHFSLNDDTDPAAIYPLVQEALAAAAKNGVSQEDMLGIVRMSETSTLLEREQLRMTGVFIAEPVALGGSDFFVTYLEQLRDVTAEDVTRVLARRLLHAPCYAVLIEKEMGADAPAALPPGMENMPPAMLEAMKARGMSMSDLMGKSDEEGSGSTKPNLETAPVVLKVDRSVLKNGAVLVSQTNDESPLMAIHLAVRGRAMLDREHAEAGALDLVHRLLSEGYSDCDRICLARRLRELGAVVKLVDDPRIPMDNYYTNGLFSFIRIELASQYGPEMLDMLVSQIQHGVFDANDFERVRDDRVGTMGQGAASARGVANTKLDELLYGDHPMVLPPEGSAESLQNLDFKEVRRVYRKAFSPENLVFSIVGPYPHEELRELIEDKLPGRGKPVAGMPPLPLTTEALAYHEKLGGEMSAIRLGSVMAMDKQDAGALQLLCAILSDRIAMDLRETRGLSYSVGVTLNTRGEQAEFTAWINPPAERVDEGLAAIKAAIRDFDATSITQDELDTTRSARKGRMMMRRLSSMGMAYYLAMAELGGDIDDYLNAMTMYDGISLADLVMVGQKYLKTMPLVEVVVD